MSKKVSNTNKSNSTKKTSTAKKTTTTKKKTTTAKKTTAKKAVTPKVTTSVATKPKKKHSGVKVLLFLLLVGGAIFGYQYFLSEKVVNTDAIAFGEVTELEYAASTRIYDNESVLNKYYQYRTFLSYLPSDNKLSKEDFNKNSYIVDFVDTGYCDENIKSVKLRSVYRGVATVEVKVSSDCNKCNTDKKLYLVPVTKEESKKIKKVETNVVVVNKNKCISKK